MAERSIVEILFKSRGGRAVASDAGVAARGVDKLGHASHTATRSLARLGTAGAVAGAALGYGLYRGAKKSLEAFAESEKVGAQTVATLKSTGGAAGITKREIENYAAALMDLTGVDDEVIQSAENMILSFRNIRGKAFKPTLDAAMDMSAFFTSMGKDMSVPDAALLISKAMNDPAKGLMRLQRQGVQFTQAQVDQAKSLQANNNLFGAQKIVLGELNKEFGGSAAAAGKTTTGAMNKLSASVENAQEAIGMGLAPAVTYVANELTKFTTHATPDLARLSKGLDATFGRKDLDMAGKLAVASRQVRSAGKPYAEQFVAGIKGAHLDQRLGDAIEWAAPKIADGAAHAAPKAAEAFVNAWMHSGPWGKLATGIYVANKVRNATGGGGMFGVRGPIAAGSAANPIAVVGMGGAGGGLAGGAGAKGWRGLVGKGAMLTGYGLAAEGGYKGLGFLSGANDTLQKKGGILGALGAVSNAGEWLGRNNPATRPVLDFMDAINGKGSKSKRGNQLDVHAIQRLAGYPDSHAQITRRGTRQIINVTVPVKVHDREIARADAKVAVTTRERDRR